MHEFDEALACGGIVLQAVKEGFHLIEIVPSRFGHRLEPVDLLLQMGRRYISSVIRAAAKAGRAAAGDKLAVGELLRWPKNTENSKTPVVGERSLWKGGAHLLEQSGIKIPRFFLVVVP